MGGLPSKKFASFYVRQSVLTGQRDMYFSIKCHTISMAQADDHDLHFYVRCFDILYVFSSPFLSPGR